MIYPQDSPEGMVVSGNRVVGLKPSSDWMRRNYFLQIYFPSMFTRRSGECRTPEWRSLLPGQIEVTWIGHASFLVATNGFRFLVDPVWAKWIKGLKRISHPGVPISHVGPVDLVLVTHAHFDHLDRKTLKRLASSQPVVVPEGVSDLVHDLGFSHVFESRHWNSFDVAGARVTLVPCRHWGARLLHDRRRSFGGYVIETPSGTVYHGGDSAYFDGFQEIGERFKIDIAILPIGAYDSPSGRDVHMNPEQALSAFEQLGAKYMIPMHYGAYRLSYEPVSEPPERLQREASAKGLVDRVNILREGFPEVFDLR